MKIHPIQTGTVAIPRHQAIGQGKGPFRLWNTLRDCRWTEPLPIYAWAIEHPEGVIVVDTGETANALTPGYFPVWHPYYRRMREWVTPEQEIGPQLRSLGIHPDDVRWVVLTHLHTDHAGGLQHFPRSEIIVMEQAYRLAQGLAGKMRGFLPHRWPEWFAPTLIDLLPQPYGSFDRSFRLTRRGDVILLPTEGHTAAHISVALVDDGLTYLFAGDASYTQDAVLKQQIDGVSLAPNTARHTLERIYQFAQATPTVYLPAHDPEATQRLRSQTVFPQQRHTVTA